MYLIPDACYLGSVSYLVGLTRPAVEERGGAIMLDEATVEQFKTGLHGELIEPDYPDYKAAGWRYSGSLR